jgi:hypothetical protein
MLFSNRRLSFYAVSFTAQPLLALKSCHRIFRGVAASSAFIHTISLVMARLLLHFSSTLNRIFVSGTAVLLFRPMKYFWVESASFNPLNVELNPISHFLALLEAHHILHVSRIRVNNSSFLFLPLLYILYCNTEFLFPGTVNVYFARLITSN